MITEKDYSDVKRVLRWAGIGALVCQARIDHAAKIANELPRESPSADAVRFAIMSLENGIQISQRDCIIAERSLDEVYESMADNGREAPRG